MGDALQVIIYIYNKLIDLFFNKFVFDGVSLGWVLVTLLMFSMVAHNILNLPKSIFSEQKQDKTDSKGGNC